MPKLPPKDYSAEYRARWREDDLFSYIANLEDAQPASRLIVQYVAASLAAAHQVAPAKWGLTKHSETARLNVGNMEALWWVPGGVYLMVHITELERSGTFQDLEPHIRFDSGPFATVPGSRYLALPANDAETLERHYRLALPAHLWHLELVKSSGINGQTRKSHHPGLVDAVGRLAGVRLEQPTYVTINKPEG